jgi:hypothetical protein
MGSTRRGVHLLYLQCWQVCKHVGRRSPFDSGSGDCGKEFIFCPVRRSSVKRKIFFGTALSKLLNEREIEVEWVYGKLENLNDGSSLRLLSVKYLELPLGRQTPGARTVRLLHLQSLLKQEPGGPMFDSGSAMRTWIFYSRSGRGVFLVYLP